MPTAAKRSPVTTTVWPLFLFVDAVAHAMATQPKRGREKDKQLLVEVQFVLWLLFPAWQEQNTVVVLMNFTIVQNLQAFGKNSSIETSTFLFNVTLPYFDKYFVIICEYETIIKFIKRTTVQKKVSTQQQQHGVIRPPSLASNLPSHAEDLYRLCPSR